MPGPSHAAPAVQSWWAGPGSGVGVLKASPIFFCLSKPVWFILPAPLVHPPSFSVESKVMLGMLSKWALSISRKEASRRHCEDPHTVVLKARCQNHSLFSAEPSMVFML